MRKDSIGYEGGGPTRISTQDGRSLVVHEVIDHWQEAKVEYMRLLADDERIYLLRRVEGNKWEVERFYGY